MPALQMVLWRLGAARLTPAEPRGFANPPHDGGAFIGSPTQVVITMIVTVGQILERIVLCSAKLGLQQVTEAHFLLYAHWFILSSVRYIQMIQTGFGSVLCVG